MESLSHSLFTHLIPAYGVSERYVLRQGMHYYSSEMVQPALSPLLSRTHVEGERLKRYPLVLSPFREGGGSSKGAPCAFAFSCRWYQSAQT